MATRGGKRNYPNRPLVGVGAVVFKHERLLLVKRKFEPKSNYWTLPGGLVKLGENAREALVREVKEECGIEVVPVRLVDVVDYIEKDARENIKYHYVLIDFETEFKAGTLTPASDILDARWFDKSDLADLALPEITEKFLKKHYFSS
ncbi:NUDIX hydrolase [candidate division KSB1 bacterium]|nr:NUDIX hydrolase [candidate division KSB1 bacterium]NIR72250.1 NUDIX hydrolase [candidate division KSB1 bacterium]NIS24221.1 NUDIX hydrolase [candidate division KSB1 bacterium]NIT71135.1 NUDIX hydrolase [candidate division KSB1 bacterium]NIU24840.1 NUDIX hydrolase [candidate division KSB1 bacterium]